MNKGFCVLALFAASQGIAADLVDTADTNGDGFVSLYELRAAYFADPDFNRRIEQSFEQYDRNGDGRISVDERQQASAATVQPYQPASAEMVIEKAINNQTVNNTEQRRDDITTGADRSAAARTETRSGVAGSNRYEQWVTQLDSDGSGGASMSELLASGDGQQWFHEKDFIKADRNEDGDLNASELAVLVQALERRHR